MWQALKLYAKLNIIFKNHIFAWFRTGKLSPWKIFTDLTGFADAALTAKGYKTLAELKQESKEIDEPVEPVEPVEKKSVIRNKPKPQERNKFGKLI